MGQAHKFNRGLIQRDGGKSLRLSYSHVRKQSMLKEMLSRETAEPAPGPSSVLNCSQNLRRDTSALTNSQPERRRDGFLTGVMWERIYRASRQIPRRFAFGVRTLCLAPSVLLISLCSCSRFEQTQKKFVFCFFFWLANVKLVYKKNNLCGNGYTNVVPGVVKKRVKMTRGLLTEGWFWLVTSRCWNKPTLWTPLILMLS